MMARLFTLCFAAAGLVWAVDSVEGANAQLAITEVMSAPKSNIIAAFRGAEYWELTNFGTNDLNLHDYGFRDSNQGRDLVKYPFSNLVIEAGESIVFFRSENAVTTPAEFRTWWGEAKLPSTFKARSYASPRLSGWDGDEVVLFDASSNLIHRVQFSRTRLGRAFTYDPETGLFGVFSVAGVDGAFAAELADDVGSPGITTGPVPVRVLQQPIDQSADLGSTVSFAIVAGGLPSPQYQWFGHGAAMSHATGATLVLSNIQPADAGAYYVWVGNGLSAATSRVAVLTVNTNPTPPTIINPPAGVTVFEGQTARFSVDARGLPPPVYEWRANGTVIMGANGPTLEIPDATQPLSGTRYSVSVSNPIGFASASAFLTVTRRPDLRFTEVMSVPANEEENRHFDWFELMNFDTNAVDLSGWRFSDEPSFLEAVTITNALMLAPGESIVFAERLDARLFAAWWGADSLPENLKVYAYSGVGLGSFGDTVFVWNAAATDPEDSVARVSWARATPGVSFECEHICYPGLGCEDEGTLESVPGVRGAFRARNGGDIGSPGYVANPPLRILSVSNELAGELKLQCRVVEGKMYRLRRTGSLSLAEWIPLEIQTATNNVLTLTDPVAATDSSWFYRIEEVQ